ncbi:MAG: hypothetical protein HND58_15040 [Planctomycetota bacterium]|nr:MAG: hypothetical protein HND58_15040 [Planctomycetota bacterium]
MHTNRITDLIERSVPNDQPHTPSASPLMPNASCPATDAPHPPTTDLNTLLTDYHRADLTLPDLAALHDITITQLLDILDSPHITAILDRLTHHANLQSQRIAAAARPLALDRLRHLTTHDPADSRPLSPALEARHREITRKAAAQLLRHTPQPTTDRSPRRRRKPDTTGDDGPATPIAHTMPRCPPNDQSRTPTRPTGPRARSRPTPVASPTTSPSTCPTAPVPTAPSPSSAYPTMSVSPSTEAARAQPTDPAPSATPSPATPPPNPPASTGPASTTPAMSSPQTPTTTTSSAPCAPPTPASPPPPPRSTNGAFSPSSSAAATTSPSPSSAPLAERSSNIRGVYFDPHLDVRPEPGSGMPFRALLEMPSVKSIHNFGFSELANSREHLEWFLASGGQLGEDIDIDNILDDSDPNQPDLFVSLDLDVIDMAFAPGVSAMNPAGWTSRHAEAAVFAAGMSNRVRCFDIMELCPPHDINARTARLAAHLFLTFLRGFTERDS